MMILMLKRKLMRMTMMMLSPSQLKASKGSNDAHLLHMHCMYHGRASDDKRKR